VTQIERRVEFFIRVLNEVEVLAPVSGYAVAKKIGYCPLHIHRWTQPLIDEGLLRRRVAGLWAVEMPKLERARRIARVASKSLTGKRKVKYSDGMEAQFAVERRLGVRLFEQPVTLFD